MVQRYVSEEPNVGKMATFFSGYKQGLSAGFVVEAQLLRMFLPDKPRMGLEDKLAAHHTAAAKLKLDDIGKNGKDLRYTGYRMGYDSVTALNALILFAGAAEIRHLLRQ